ncbi:MAG: hypothetical protein IJT98_03910 [Prevotella sp.]|nr:hypothetical protein [Prevotella sp.]
MYITQTDPSPVSGINTVANPTQGNGNCYNLAGQRVSPAAKGLYIVNGRKVVVR